MEEKNSGLETLNEIKSLMEHSSRFISLSGWSGVLGGVCAIAGGFVAKCMVESSGWSVQAIQQYGAKGISDMLKLKLLLLAAATFLAAFALAFVVTCLRGKRQNVPLWGLAAKRMLVSGVVPMLVGMVVVLRVLHYNQLWLVVPLSLLFYGLALINAGKYTVSNIRQMGYAFLALGCINLWLPAYGLYFWMLGFGLLHVAYGVYMWYKFERKRL